MKRTGSAVWRGGIKDGKGTVSTESTVLSGAQYSFSTRFEAGVGTNPEELIAGARRLFLDGALEAVEDAGTKAAEINTTATVSLEKTDAGFSVTKVHLDVSVKAEGGEQTAVETATNNAKAGCPVSRLLNAEITMEAKLEA